MPKLYTFYERILAVNMEKMRLDRYLSKILGVSRSQVAQLVDKKMVLVNGKVAKKSGVWVEESDEIKIIESAISCHSERSEESKKNNPVILSEAKCLKNNRDSSPLAQNDNAGLDSADSQNLPQIERIYEDNDILVLNKPPFLATHGAPSLKEPSLVEWLKAHKIQRSTISGELREGIVHRLDKQTSGALVVAKNNVAHQALSAQLADKTMTRLYLAIIDLPLKEDIEIECFLARNPKNRLKISKVDVRKIRRIAESNENNPRVSANLETRPLRGAKNRIQGCRSATADFLLEAEKRGSPPKSEKRSFWRVGGAGRGVQPFCEKETNKIDGKRGAESSTESQSGLPRSHLLARNDDSITDSALPKFARYSKSKFYKLLPSKDGKKELILARLFTGRTHQIRAHLESINRHIVGDELYGYRRGKGENYRVMLHAYLLELRHPNNIIFAESSALNSSLGASCVDFGNLGRFADLSPVSHPKFPKNSTTSTANTRIYDLDSTNQAQSAESALDSAKSQNLIKNNLARSANPCKSFCFVWLLPNEESPLPLNHNLPNNADSANLRFIAPLFDDMQDYLAKNFDMEKVDEILRTLPARAF